MSRPRGFTLIELLVVIAIIAILAVVVVLTLNPAELLRQSRDSSRLSDLATIASALGIYSTDQAGASTFSLGNASSVSISVSDTTSTCANLGLPALASGYSYQCASSTVARNVNGTGWIPVNFSKITAGAPIGALPIDPVNQTGTGLYYSYYATGTQYEVTSIFESQKYKTQFATNVQDPDYPEVDAKGASLSISPLFNSSGLVGWWPMEEGSGSSTADQSGDNGTGAWNGTPTSGSYYTAGKVGSYAGIFDGSTNYIDVANQSPYNIGTGNFSIIAWIDETTAGANRSIFKKGDYDVGGYVFWIDSVGNLNLTTDDGTNVNFATSGSPISTNVWYQVAISVNRTGSTTIMVDGVTQSAGGTIAPGSLNTGSDVQIGNSSPAIGLFLGKIDDVRMYSRAVSVAEVQALYNAEK